MKVQLINYTTNALDLLLLTKHTMLSKNIEDAQQIISSWDDKKKMEELDYMLKTIASSWEFVDYVFVIEGVSRSFTHQFVRTRTGSYAQQSQRTVDMDGFDYVTPKGVMGDDEMQKDFDTSMVNINSNYKKMLNRGMPPQDARGILPTNIATNITAKFNLRTLSDMAKKRLCPRTQGEYQEVFKAMRNEVIKVHPWAEKFLRVYCASVGVCQFPNFKECPIKGGLFNPETGYRWDEKIIDKEEYAGSGEVRYIPKHPNTLDEQQVLWENMDYEATPKWKGRS